MEEVYKKKTVGSVMVTDFFYTDSKKSIKQVLTHLAKKKGRYEFMDYGYILNKKKELVGVFSVGDLFRYNQKLSIEKITAQNPISVNPHSKDEVAVHTALRNKIKAIPVVEKGKMVGVVPPKRLLRIMHRSTQEDFMHMAGISEEHLEYDDTMKVPIYKSVQHRAPWLLVGLAGIMLTAGFIGQYEEPLHDYMILAFFIPAIVYLAGAVGAQNITTCIRDLATHGKDMNKIKYLIRQTSIVTLLGIIISLASYLIIIIFWREYYTGFVIALAVFLSAMITNFVSLLTTYTITKLGKDPAFGSGPFATVVSDFTSIATYFIVATILLL